MGRDVRASTARNHPEGRFHPMKQSQCHCAIVRRKLAATHPSAVEKDMAHIRQSSPDSGLGFQFKSLRTFQVVPSLLSSGRDNTPRSPNSSSLERLNTLKQSRTLLSGNSFSRGDHPGETRGNEFHPANPRTKEQKYAAVPWRARIEGP